MSVVGRGASLSDPDLLLVLHVLSFHVVIIAYSSHLVLWPHRNHKPIISVFMRFALFFTRPIIVGKTDLWHMGDPRLKVSVYSCEDLRA